MRTRSSGLVAVVFGAAFLGALGAIWLAGNPLAAKESATSTAPARSMDWEATAVPAPLWVKSYGDFYAGRAGDEYDAFQGIVSSGDGGYVVVGQALLFYPPPGTNSSEAIALKVDSSGNVKWQVAFGGLLEGRQTQASAVARSSDGGYYVVGTRVEPVGDRFEAKVMVMKLQANGGVAWTKAYGGSKDLSFTEGKAVGATTDGGCLIAAYSDAFTLQAQIWLMRLTASGSIAWQKAIGDPGVSVIPYSIQADPRGGIIVVGYASYCVESTGCNTGYERGVVYKLNASGGLEWRRSFVVTPWEENDCLLYSVASDPDGGYIISGVTGHSGHGAAQHLLLIKLDRAGRKVWHKAYPITAGVSQILSTKDGSYVLSGGLGLTRIGSGHACQWSRQFTFRAGTGVAQKPDGTYMVTASSSATADRPWILSLNSTGLVGLPCPSVQPIDVSGRPIVTLINAVAAFQSKDTTAVSQNLPWMSSAGPCIVKPKCGS